MDSRSRFVVVFMGLMSALLLIILCGVVMDLRSDVQDLKSVIAAQQGHPCARHACSSHSQASATMTREEAGVFVRSCEEVPGS